MSAVPVSALCQIAPDVVLGARIKINPFVNLYGCRIGDDCMIGTFVEIQRGVVIGHRCRIQSHTFICSGVIIEADVFVGHGVMFINDRNPSAAGARTGAWRLEPILVRAGASLGSGVVVMAGVEIGAGAVIGAGALVLGNVASGATVAGVPARVIRAPHSRATP